jgi:hypothetical protein
MDYIHRLSRQSDLYEKKKRLELISHSQLRSGTPKSRASDAPPLPPPVFAPHGTGTSTASTQELKISQSAGGGGGRTQTPKDFTDSDRERWRQEIKEKRMRAELKGFHSVGTQSYDGHRDRVK